LNQWSESNKTWTIIYLFDIKRGFFEKISLTGHFWIIHFTYFAKSYIFHQNHQISLRRWLFLNHWSEINNFLWNEILSLGWICPYDLFRAMLIISKVIKLSTRFFHLFLEMKILKTRFRWDKMIPIPQTARLKLLSSIQIGRYQ
jgi:hypothetical protein